MVEKNMKARIWAEQTQFGWCWRLNVPKVGWKDSFLADEIFRTWRDFLIWCK
jgi:hypothetical protein